ncbi:MAG: alcohol dehydrogenase catalytic domain-containing protein [Gammaproteobacteria bacterium]|nr:alcohol dehydrogenase catalytic domain-containing protein [Gammaproteobacteria bacterium]MDH5303113.1 alcohol dehydrogenase catalytic domain-containing protein [Gammaproteobacteria bacterium]
MRAMLLNKIASMQDQPEPLQLAEIPRPEPAANEVLLRVNACGVCHTELDEIEGRTPPSFLPIVPGHEVVGRVAGLGADVTAHAVGDRVGVGWIARSSGGEHENIDAGFVATGRDVNGGYAEYMTVHEQFAYRVPEGLSDVEVAPLLCAGSVGYRALKLAGIGGHDVLGLTGFGASGHLVLQLASYLYPQSPVYVFARSPAEREFALDLGADWAGSTDDTPPQPPHAIIDTTPVWHPVLAALKCLRPGGILVINAIRKENSDRQEMATIDYTQHLWQEKRLQTVANITRHDISAFLEIANKAGIRPEIRLYRLEDANKALQALRRGQIRGANVLAIADQFG